MVFLSPELTLKLTTCYQTDKWFKQPLNWTEKIQTPRFQKPHHFMREFGRNVAKSDLEINPIAFQSYTPQNHSWTKMIWVTDSKGFWKISRKFISSKYTAINVIKDINASALRRYKRIPFLLCRNQKEYPQRSDV